MTVEKPNIKNNNELHKAVSAGSLSLCSVGSDAVDLLPDVGFNIVGSSNEGTIDSTGTNRENEPLLSRDDIQPLNHISGITSLVLSFKYAFPYSMVIVSMGNFFYSRAYFLINF